MTQHEQFYGRDSSTIVAAPAGDARGEHQIDTSAGAAAQPATAPQTGRVTSLPWDSAFWSGE